jgi:hypothetical protein
MKRIVMCLLLGSWAVAIAQEQPGEEQAAGADAGEQVPPCVSATDTPQATAAASGPLESQSKVAGQASVPCEEQDPEATPGEEQRSAETPGEIVADPETIEELDSDAETSAEEEFKPGDEISEDYPVPLPSDI